MKTVALLAMLAVPGSLSCAQSQAQMSAPNDNSALNFGFEDGLNNWRAPEATQMNRALSEAAHTGKMGLRVEDNDGALGSSLFSAQAPVEAGASYQMSYWARTKVKNGAGVWAKFYGANGQPLSTALTPVANVKNADGNWSQVAATLQAPAKAAFVAFWIHTYTAAIGSFDFDDFSVTKSADATEVAPVVLPAPVARKTPAYIIIKADDLIYEDGSVNPKWQQFVDFIRARGIKASIGIIANSLEADHPAYFQWIKDQKASGLIEFWNHGYDHKQWTENGKTIQEFNGPSYQQQQEHLEKSNRLAREKLGFAFQTFGAPFNATDANTVKALEADGDIKVWLYGDPKNPAQKTVIDRVAQVNIEAPIFEPDALKFAQGYNQFPDRAVFAIQGHPTHWTPEGFAQWMQIINFLTKAKAIFVTPSQYAQLKRATATPDANR